MSAVILGIILVTTIRPGIIGSVSEDVSNATMNAMDTVKTTAIKNTTQPLTRQVLTADTLLDLIRLV